MQNRIRVCLGNQDLVSCWIRIRLFLQDLIRIRFPPEAVPSFFLNEFGSCMLLDQEPGFLIGRTGRTQSSWTRLRNSGCMTFLVIACTQGHCVAARLVREICN